MALAPISAVDAVAPAWDRMRQLLFGPVRLGLWLRLFLIGLLTGELSTGGGGNWLQSVFQLPGIMNRASAHRHFVPMPWGSMPWSRLPVGRLGFWLPLLLIALLFVVVIVLLVMYLGSVLRFVLLETIINGQVRLRQSFRRWRPLAASLFLLRLWLTLILWALFVPLVAVPLLRLWRVGFRFEALRSMLPLLAVVVALVVLLSLLSAVVWLFIKDFAVPLMALEDLSAGQACLRVWQMLRAEPGAYAGYVGMKIVLAIAAGMIAGIAVFLLIVLLLIPIVLLIVFGVVGTSTAGHALAFALAIALGVLLIIVAIVVSSAIGVAVMVFFQAYTVRFFAGHYEPLAALLFPQAPPPLVPAPEP